jgi:hypothetical protein
MSLRGAGRFFPSKNTKGSKTVGYCAAGKPDETDVMVYCLRSRSFKPMRAMCVRTLARIGIRSGHALSTRSSPRLTR